ncbi:hypothetical protein NEMBOFW57_004976 [Staphylotrichum longicolle]|uniref:C2H2-type domain-containing protein n=1 Tax=Staphylotrichum longicolle TaxID=669026 RepID=A0AAD4EZH7_9PEZI|nr:hypothetical protein NEMBOFW57_004976 [Staphylotrichum longicolle]
MEPAFAGFGIPRSSQQRASVPATRPTCIAPDVLSHPPEEIKSFVPQNTQVPVPEVVEIEDDESEDDAGPEQEEIESHVDVDDRFPIQMTRYSPTVDLDDESQARAVLQSLISKGKLGNFLKEIGYPILEAAETKDEKPHVDSSAASDSGRLYKCGKCVKTFNRRCELKKHQKRHEKPYACTFAKCDRRFGSKNDWKRHENSQHVQLEIWRCTEMTSITTTTTMTPGDQIQRQQQQKQECGKVCHRLESLKAHLEKAHAIHDPAVLDRKLADCRMGRNFESRFWCGFCQKTIEPTNSSGPAHSELWGGAERLAGRKRAYHEVGELGPAKVKRSKDGSGSGGKVVIWTCCFCNNYWRKHLTTKCMSGNGCDHALCDDCVVDEIRRELDS